MSGTRLPLLGARRAPPRSAPTAPIERLPAPRRLLCLSGADSDAPLAPALLDVAQSLLRALAERGSRATVLLAAGELREDQLRSLRDSGADSVIELPAAELGVAAHRALERLPSQALALGLGAGFAQQLRPLFTMRIGPARRLDGQADLELPSDSALVSSAIAARLA